MAIELGALSLAIRDQGGDALLGKLRQIDKQAAGVGRTPITLGVQSAGLTQATAGLTRLIAELSRATGVEALRGDALRTLVTMEADLAKRVNDTSLAMEQRVTIGSALQRVQKALNAATGEGVAASQQETAASRAATAAAEAEARAVNKLAAERAKERAILASPRAPAGSTASTAAELAAFRERIAVEARAAAASQMAARTPVATAQPAAALAQTRARIAEVIADVQRMARAVDVADAKAVAAFRRDAAEALNYARAIKATAAEMGTLGTAVASVGTRQQAATVATTRAGTAMRAQGNEVTVLGRRITNAQGSIIGAGRAGITAINGVAFAASQMAATGEMSFRSVATALSSFAAFFGTGGAIVSLVATTGLALTDFFTRRQKEVSDLAQKTIDETMRAVRAIQFATERGDAGALTERARGLQEGTGTDVGVDQLKKQAADLQADIDAKLKRFEALDVREGGRRRFQLAEEINALKAQRAGVVKDIATLEDEITSLMGRTVSIGPPAKDVRDAITVSTTALKAQKDTLDQQIAALKTLGELRKVDVRALETAHGLLVRLTAESAKQGLSLEAQAQTLARINALLQTGVALQAKVRKITPDTAQAATKIAITPQQREQLNKGLGDGIVLTDLEQSIADGIGNAIMGGISAGFASGLAEGGIGEGFKQMGAVMLAGLGDVFLQVGAKAIIGSQIIGSLALGLKTLNPILAIAAGTALLALAAAMGAKGGKSGGGARGLSSSSSISGRETISDPYWNRATLPVSARPSSARAAMAPAGQIVNVIGINTPQGQRLIGESNAGFVRRGG